MLFAIRPTLTLTCCCLLLAVHVLIVSSGKKHRFFHHHHHHHHHLQKQLDPDNKLNGLFHRQFGNRREQNYDTKPCTKLPCSMSNECIRLQHRHNHTKLRHRCMCTESSCRGRPKNRRFKMKSHFVK
jgi:hypothetical protein